MRQRARGMAGMSASYDPRFAVTGRADLKSLEDEEERLHEQKHRIIARLMEVNREKNSLDGQLRANDRFPSRWATKA